MRQGKPELSNPMSGGRKGSTTKSFLGTQLLVLVLLVGAVVYLLSGGRGGAGEVDVSQSSAQDKVIKDIPSGGLKKKKEPKQKKKKETLVLETKHGDLKIVLRPDLSKESVDYIHKLVKEGCTTCEFYRAEEKGIFQGIIKNPNVEKNKVLGECPEGYEDKPSNCPKHDPNCGCHGPIMTRGMVGWAGGSGGPDFFIHTYDKPAKWWYNWHTVWGELQDDESFKLTDHVYTLPTKDNGGMTMLEERIKFTAKLIQE